MKEYPMIFNSEMVRGILDGRKTQTRRIIKNQREGECWSVKPAIEPRCSGHTHDWWLPTATRPYSALHRCPFGAVGERIWVRETFGSTIRNVGGTPHEKYTYRATEPDAVRCYDCNGNELPIKWTPSIHMPRSASRITLEITAVRVERLNGMSEEDAIAEGCGGGHGSIPGYMYSATPHEHFHHIWTSIYGEESWQANPWVWVIEFKRVEGGEA